MNCHDMSLVIRVLVSTAVIWFAGKGFGVAADADRKAAVKGVNAFGTDLYGRVRGQEGNLFLSPYSISTALAMAYAGARGETADQMADVLHFRLPEDRLHAAFGAVIDDLGAASRTGDVEVNVANRLWGQKGYPLLAEFLDLTRRRYGAGLEQVDFMGAAEAARKTINAWVEEQTNDKIQDLIGPDVLGRRSVLVLTNAIYFKGKWALPFEEKHSGSGRFTLANGDTVSATMMRRVAEFRYMEADDFQAIELPYVGDRFAMFAFLPKKAGGLPELEKALTVDRLEGWIAGLRSEMVTVLLPRFKLSATFCLSEVLQSMGMRDAFSVPRADFSGIDGRRELCISDVLHKAFVDVSEEGTEAAAATAVVLGRGMARRFRADHPFLFLIRDRGTGTILFLGRLVNPKE